MGKKLNFQFYFLLTQLKIDENTPGHEQVSTNERT